VPPLLDLAELSTLSIITLICELCSFIESLTERPFLPSQFLVLGTIASLPVREASLDAKNIILLQDQTIELKPYVPIVFSEETVVSQNQWSIPLLTFSRE
jgi:hypothetical protein